MQRTLPRRVTNRNVVIKPDAQIDELPLELRRQRLERARRANRGRRRGIERLFAGSPIQAEALRGKTAVAINPKRNRNNPLVAQIKRFRHHRDPILFQLRKQPVDITLKIHALGGSENRDAVARLRAASTSSASTAASPTTSNCAFRTV